MNSRHVLARFEALRSCIACGIGVLLLAIVMLCSCISLPVNIEQSLAVATVPAESYILLAKLAPRFLCSFVQGLFDLMSKFLTKRMIMTRPRSGKVCLASSRHRWSAVICSPLHSN